VSTKGERFAEIRKREGLSQLAMAERLGISKAYVSHIENDAREAGRDVLDRLATVFGVNLNWYFYGKDSDDTPDDSDNVTIPLIRQEVAAGRGMEISDFPETGAISVHRSLIAGHNPKSLRAVIVRGESQRDRGICDKDIVVYDTTEKRPENLSVVSVGGQLVIKYVSVDRLKGTISLLSANEAFPPRIIKASEVDGVRIEGKVILNMHRM
jgi:transcriptional regulator with XRE-family HTH domain